MTSLIVVDVQRDFCEGGALPVSGGNEVAQKIADLMLSNHKYDYVIATRDWHVNPGDHFSETPDYENTWPVHCRAYTHGAAYHAAIPFTEFDAEFKKGKFSAAYSGFEGMDLNRVLLSDWLERHRVDAVDIVGIATDYCVRATALDAAKHGLHTRVLMDLTAYVDWSSNLEAIRAMNRAGIETVH
jgi:nicotinamidase/pyrazinamidase